MNVTVKKVPLRRFLPQIKVWTQLHKISPSKICMLATASFVLPNPSSVSPHNKEFLEETVVKCPIHSYTEPIRDQVEKIKEEVQPKSLIQCLLCAVRNVTSTIHLCFRAVQILIIFTPALLSSWILYFPSLRHYWYVLLVATLRVGGSSFMKLGQWSATRPDIMPLDLCKELSKLHSTAKQIEFDKIEKVLNKELGRSYQEVFDELDKEPIGSGCIAQVYKARIKGTNEWVALKIKRPEVDDSFSCDLKLLNFFAKIIQFLPFMSYINPQEGARLFANTMQQQLDFRVEAINLLHFRENYRVCIYRGSSHII